MRGAVLNNVINLQNLLDEFLLQWLVRCQFLTGKSSFKALKASIKLEKGNVNTENDTEEEKEEWMFISELNVQDMNSNDNRVPPKHLKDIGIMLVIW